MKIKKHFFGLLILLSGIALLTLTSMTQDCYTIWVQAFSDATDNYHDGIRDCHNDPFVIGLINPIQHCLWEANETYDGAINTAVDEYEDCLNRD